MIDIFSLNVKGLNSNAKRSLALREFKRSKADIILIQETHFAKTGTMTFAWRHYPHIYQASGPHKRAGVADLFKQGSPFQLQSLYSDPLGHYLILRGLWSGANLTLCNVYAPNTNQIPFLSLIAFLKPPNPLVIGGDFNLIHSPGLDKHSVGRGKTQVTINRKTTQFRQLTRKYALFDTWRTTYPSAKQFTFYSHPHKSHSWLDYFFVNTPTLWTCKDSDIQAISWSDHAPITLSLALSSSSFHKCHWRLNDFLFKHDPSRVELEQTLNLYFIENCSPEISASSLFEGHKAVFWGQCISLSTALKRNANATRCALLDKLKHLEARLLLSPSLAILRELVSVRAGLRDIDLGKIEKALIRLRQTYYDKANKPHTLLAKQLRDRAATTTTTHLRDTRRVIDNTRRVIDLVEVANRNKLEAILLSLDAEKAFDSLGWPFLFATLNWAGI